MSAWMYSMMWPIWNGPLANGSAVVTNMGRWELIARMIADSPLSADAGTLSAVVLDRLELGLVHGLLVGVLAADHGFVEQLLDRRVHDAHAVHGPALHGVFQLVELALADQVRDCRRVHH